MKTLRLSDTASALGRLFAFALVVAAALVALSGCGGGGGGNDNPTIVVGRVLDSSKSDAPVAGARVEIGGRTATTTADDPSTPADETGNFRITGASAGASEAVITVPGQAAQRVLLPAPVSPGATNNVGDLVINIGSLRGRVLSAAGAPVPNAIVTVVSIGATVNTDANGVFTIANVPEGQTEITAVFGTASVTTTVTIAPTGVTDVGDLRLVDDPNPNPPGAPVTVTGTATLPAGSTDSAAGTTIIVLRRASLAELERTTTIDAQGTFNLYLPPGDYRLVAQRAGYTDAQADVSVTNPSQPVAVSLVLTR